MISKPFVSLRGFFSFEDPDEEQSQLVNKSKDMSKGKIRVEKVFSRKPKIFSWFKRNNF